MGWKKLKDHFSICHNVIVSDEGICIGSGYVHNLAVIDTNTGKLLEHLVFPGFLKENYPELLKADPEAILELIKAEDSFAASIPVYTYEGKDILELQCEEFGYPNTTHCGRLMYENTFFRDRLSAVKKALSNAESGVSLFADQLEQAREKLARIESDLKEAQVDVATLQAELQRMEADGD